MWMQNRVMNSPYGTVCCSWEKSAKMCANVCAFTVQFSRHQCASILPTTYIQYTIFAGVNKCAQFFFSLVPLYGLYNNNCAQSIVCIGIFCFLLVVLSVDFCFQFIYQTFKNRQIAFAVCRFYCFPFLLFLFLLLCDPPHFIDTIYSDC